MVDTIRKEVQNELGKKEKNILNALENYCFQDMKT